MEILTWILSAVLLAIAALHALWGIGLWIPIRDEAGLARAVLGARGVTRMPGAIACSLVAVALMAAVFCLWWPEGWLRQLALAGIATVFGLRGVAPYLPFWRKLTPEEPFATLDRRVYGPLCLMLALGFGVIVIA